MAKRGNAAWPGLFLLALVLPVHAEDAPDKKPVYHERPDSRIYREVLHAVRDKVDSKALDLILKDEDINVADEDGNTALIIAAREGNLGVVQVLVERGADIHANTHYHYNVMRSAISGRSFPVVSFLIAKGIDVNEVWDDRGSTPLIEASGFGLVDVVDLLLAKGAKVNARTQNGYDALTAAAENGHAEVVAVLADHGAEINRPANEGMTPLMWAALSGHLDAVTRLVEKGAKVNLPSEPYGETALALASKPVSANGTDHLGVVKYLLQHGANPSIPDKNGYTALMIAAVYGRLDVLKALVAGGADLKSSEGDGAKAFRASLDAKRLSSLQTLLDLGANPDWKLANDYPALIYAIDIEQSAEMVAMLVKAKANVNVTRKQGIIFDGPSNGNPGPAFYEYSALIAAVREGSLPMVKLLLQAGANTNDKDSEGKTALDRARERKNPEMVQLLAAAK